MKMWGLKGQVEAAKNPLQRSVQMENVSFKCKYEYFHLHRIFLENMAQNLSEH